MTVFAEVFDAIWLDQENRRALIADYRAALREGRRYEIEKFLDSLVEKISVSEEQWDDLLASFSCFLDWYIGEIPTDDEARASFYQD